MQGEDRLMKTVCARGFTLIELLVVIAIIAILASLLVVAGPGVLMRAKLADVRNDMNQIRTALATYYSQWDSYPPGYGYRLWGWQKLVAEAAAQGLPAPEEGELFQLVPYTAMIGYHGNLDVYDRFDTEESHDTDRDGNLRPLEFLPVGTENPPGSDNIVFPADLYPGAEAMVDAALQLDEQRPYIYIPVNLDQFEKVKRYYYRQYEATGDVRYMNAKVWDDTDAALVQVISTDEASGGRDATPPRYDSYVLISKGPYGSTCGLLADTLGGEGLDPYRILGLRTYFLATRDYNDNDKLDFDYVARSQQGENEDAYDAGEEALAKMPSGTAEPGPLIYVVE
jgi:prepilin-type N-terminal cleavage/methylation domain-containing protein